MSQLPATPVPSPAPGSGELPTPSPASPDDAQRPLQRETGGTRELMLCWCLWLLGSWAVTLSIDSPIPAVRWMVFSTATGLFVMWPLVRLSQASLGRVFVVDGEPVANPRRPSLRIILLDWLSLMVILQAVVWPLRLVGGWSMEQAVWVDVALAGWSLLIGAIIGAGRAMGGGGRAAAMAACMLLLFAEPALLGLAPGAWEPRVSPMPALWYLTTRDAYFTVKPVREAVAVACVAAVAAWAALGVVRLATRGRA